MADEKKAVASKNDTTAKKAPAKNKKPNIFVRFFRYLKEVKSELKKVTWPTSKQVVRDTLTVIVIVAISALFIGVIDLVFKNIVSFSVGNGLSSLF